MDEPVAAASPAKLAAATGLHLSWSDCNRAYSYYRRTVNHHTLYRVVLDKYQWRHVSRTAGTHRSHRCHSDLVCWRSLQRNKEIETSTHGRRRLACVRRLQPFHPAEDMAHATHFRGTVVWLLLHLQAAWIQFCPSDFFTGFSATGRSGQRAKCAAQDGGDHIDFHYYHTDSLGSGIHHGF